MVLLTVLTVISLSARFLIVSTDRPLIIHTHTRGEVITTMNEYENNVEYTRGVIRILILTSIVHHISFFLGRSIYTLLRIKPENKSTESLLILLLCNWTSECIVVEDAERGLFVSLLLPYSLPLSLSVRLASDCVCSVCAQRMIDTITRVVVKKAISLSCICFNCRMENKGDFLSIVTLTINAPRQARNYQARILPNVV